MEKTPLIVHSDVPENGDVTVRRSRAAGASRSRKEKNG